MGRGLNLFKVVLEIWSNISSEVIFLEKLINYITKVFDPDQGWGRFLLLCSLCVGIGSMGEKSSRREVSLTLCAYTLVEKTKCT